MAEPKDPKDDDASAPARDEPARTRARDTASKLAEATAKIDADKAAADEARKAAEAKAAQKAAEADALAAFEAAESGAAAAPAKTATPEPTPPATPAKAAEPEAKAEAKPAASGKGGATTTDPRDEGDLKAAFDGKLAAKAKIDDGKPAAARPAPKADDKAKTKIEPDVDPNRLPEPPPWYKTLRADPPFYVSMALGIGMVALLLAVWWFVTRGAPTERIISPSKLPSPGEVFGSLDRLLERDLFDSILDTLYRVFKGVGLAALVGVGVGVLAASNRGVGAALAPLIIFLRSVPMGALIPLTLLLFAEGERQKTMFLFLAIVPFVFSDTVKAISIVPDRYVETAQTLGASRFQIVRKVLVPLALPDIITSLRFQLGLALGYIMLVEIIDTPFGLGKLINSSERQGLYEHVYLLLFVIALIAFTLDYVLRELQRLTFAWRKDL